VDTKLIDHHIRRFFAGHSIHESQWTHGPAQRELPQLRVLHISPGPRLKWWTFITVGASSANAASPLEYLMIGDEPRTSYAEILTMLAYYGIAHTLDEGHTMAIGKTLEEGSPIDRIYLSLPYPFGPELEVCRRGEEEIRILWAFPITRSEQELLLREGADALEGKFEDRHVKFWSPTRKPVV
jgi:suppressor of fused protein SUFU